MSSHPAEARVLHINIVAQLTEMVGMGKEHQVSLHWHVSTFHRQSLSAKLLDMPHCRLIVQHQKRPTISPSWILICSEAGTLGNPGIVMMLPVTATINSAPLQSRSSRTVRVCPVGAFTFFLGHQRMSTASWQCTLGSAEPSHHAPAPPAESVPHP